MLIHAHPEFSQNCSVLPLGSPNTWDYSETVKNGTTHYGEGGLES